MTTKEMEENAEMKFEDLDFEQLDILMSLGEIDACSYYECYQDLEQKTLFFRIKNKIKKLIKFIFGK
jgi:hypothetical protein